MAANILVSYDGTPNDDDALALARQLARTGASLALAYVRHSREFDPEREELAQHDAEQLLVRGADWLGQPGIARHIVVSASTGEGLAALAESESATMIVFGSDYRTPPGRSEPGTTAQYLLEGGPVAVAVATAGLRSHADAPIRSISVLAPEGDSSAERTAQALAGKLGATVTTDNPGAVDLIVVGSAAADGRVALSGPVRSQLNAISGSVLVLPRGRALAL